MEAIGNVTYSFGNSSLALPSTPTFSRPETNFYGTGSPSLGAAPTNFNFSSTPLNIGPGGGGGPFGSAALPDIFSNPEIAKLFRLPQAQIPANTPNQIAPSGPNVLTKAQQPAIGPSVFKDTVFKPLPNVYANPLPGTASSPPQTLSFSFTSNPSLVNTLNGNPNARTNIFGRDPVLKPNGTPITFTFATGDTAKLFGGNTPRSSASGANVVAQSVAKTAATGQPVAYANYSEGTAFRSWAESGAMGAIPHGSKNCWEVILSAAIDEGRLSREKVASAYKGGPVAIQNLLTNNLQNVNRYDASLVSQPKVGDLVYFKLSDVDGKPFKDAQGRYDPTPLLDHVGMVVDYKNGQPVIASHYPKNAETATTPVNAPLELTTIGDLRNRFGQIGKVDVFFGAPSW